MTKCDKSHFYDADKYNGCPHCNKLESKSLDTPPAETADDFVYTVNQDAVSPASEPPSKNDGYMGSSAIDKTTGFFHQFNMDPVVGWLVCVKGFYFGQCFNLKAGRNFIGRSPNNDLALSQENSISRNKHAIVIYEPKNRVFTIQAGEGKGLVYVNKEHVVAHIEIKAYDRVELGDAEFIFIPFCGGNFSWDDIRLDI